MSEIMERFRRNDSGEQVMYDLDVAQVAKMADPHKIRPLIKKHAAALGPLSAHERKLTGGRPCIEYWLTEAQALYLLGKCRSAGAVEHLGRISAVYSTARKGNGAAAVALAQGAAQPANALDAFEAMVKAMREQDRRTAQLERSAAALETAQTQQETRLAKIEDFHARTLRELATPDRPTAPELPGLSLRQLTVSTLRWVAYVTKEPYEDVNRKAYRLLKQRYHYDVNARYRKRSQSKIDIIEADGRMEWLFAIAEYLAKPLRASHDRAVGHA
jgi:hypothetical protein